MNLSDFFQSLNKTLESASTDNPLVLRCLQEATLIMDTADSDEVLAKTQMTILFEGFYQSLEVDSPLKKPLCELRTQRWDSHFGTPTVTFLITFKEAIEQTKAQFQKSGEEAKPWLIQRKTMLEDDKTNDVMVNRNSLFTVPMPDKRETLGSFVKTHNPFGGFTMIPADPFSQKFIERAASVAKTGGKVLEIGAGFGSATLEALAKGATVYCNDIEPQNLAVIRRRYQEINPEAEDSLTGDNSHLVLVPGALPAELKSLPQAAFEAILICRVLHFSTGKQIENSLRQMLELLAPGGKIYIVCETPYLKNWQRFIPEFNERCSQGVEWPGEITEPASFEASGRAESLPTFVHWITKEVMERTLTRTGHEVEEVAYINRTKSFPEDLILPSDHPDHGKESIGGIGMKPA